MNLLDVFSLPIGAGPNAQPIGLSEFGGPVYRTSTGHEYTVREPMARETQRPQPRPSPLMEVLQRDSGQDRRDARHGIGGNPDAPNPLLAAARALTEGALQGVTAPGRALQGEPVTLGDAWATALDFGAIANVVPAPAGALRSGNARTQGIRAYHGSPHDFDKFSMDKIGTGEGAQAYGHGLYFAENEGVARGYRDDLTAGLRLEGKPIDTVWIDEIRERWPSMYSGLSEADGEVMDTILGTMSGMETMNDMRNAARSAGPRGERLFNARVAPALAEPPKGRMYEVNINASPDEFLDWDAPLSEQPEALRALVNSMDTSGLSSRYRKTIEAHRGLPGDFKPDPGQNIPEPSGNMIHSALTDFGTDVAKNTDVTRALREAGIPGIKYRDAGSRGIDGAEGTRNFVVFDDSLISIIRKYGIGAVAAGLGLTAADLEAQAQEAGVSLAP